MTAVSFELELSGRRYTGWEKVTVTRSLEAIAAAYQLEIAGDEVVPVNSGAEARLYADGELILDGFVDAARVTVDDRGRSLSVAGRDRTAELVDCSALNDPPEFYGITLVELVAELAAPFGVDVVDERADLGQPFAKFALQPGESAFEAIERACRLRGVLPAAEAGAIVFARPGSAGRADVVLELGETVKAVAAEHNLSGRFRDYIVRGQTATSEDVSPDELAGVEGRATDPLIRAPRSLVVIGEGAIDPATAQRRAQWEAVVRAARGSRWTCTVVGWREKPGGELWRPNRLALCRFPSAFLEVGDLLVTAVKYSISEGEGTTAELELMRRDAFLPEVPLRPENEPTFGEDVDGTTEGG